MSLALDLLILATGWTHILLAPYTKVEESFNLHAAHDVLFHGVGPDALRHYDHTIFPGAVPRTFIGAILLAYVSKPLILLGQWTGLILHKSDAQLIIRLVLTTLNGLTLCLIRRATLRCFGSLPSLFFVLLSVTQFHLPFWMGRTLPNMYALIFVNLATYLSLDRAPQSTRLSPSSARTILALLTFTTVIFRSELLLYLAPITLQILLSKSLSFWSIVGTGLLTGVLSIALTTSIDAYFWSTPFPSAFLFPELYSLYFNVYLSKSSEWGTSPWHTYISSFLPKLLLSSLPLSLLSLFTSGTRARSLVWPNMVFIGLISALAHKEWRFIIYTIPAFNVSASLGASWLATRRRSSRFGLLSLLAVVGCLVLNIVASFLLAGASMRNYPGGEALAAFHQMIPPTRPYIKVHISNLAAQSGASLFLQENSAPYLSSSSSAKAWKDSFLSYGTQRNWIYDKTENFTLSDLTADHSITHLISEIPPSQVALLPETRGSWKVAKPIEAFGGFGISPARVREVVKEVRSGKGVRALGELVGPRVEEVLWIYERAG